MAEQGNTREFWAEMNPNLRQLLSEIAFSDSGESLTPELRDRLQDNALQDFIEQEQGEK